MHTRLNRRSFLIAACAAVPLTAPAQTAPARLGLVLMHGKGGSPARHVNTLAAALAAQGVLVANLEMPWSARREYDVPVAAAEQEVDAAVASLRSQGAQKIVVAGHSQGGLFALFYASRHAVDGVIAIAPGGDPSGAVPREKLAAAVQTARTLVAEGKGNEATRLDDYEGAKGVSSIRCTPATYLSWFDPEQGPAMRTSIAALPANTAVLYVAPSKDYPALSRSKAPLFGALPQNPLTQLYEPEASHLGAPDASIARVLEWTRLLAGGV